MSNEPRPVGDVGQGTSATSLPVVLPSDQSISVSIPDAVDVSGSSVTISGTPTVDASGSSVTISGTPTVIVSGIVSTKETRGATATASNVAGSASSVTVLAANANRLGACVYNDSSAVLYLKLGDTASSSSFTIKMAADGYFEVPFNYTGVIDGIWASATGSARVTEIT